jgi:glycosyltransferase involved in cell wall biosynthesis
MKIIHLILGKANPNRMNGVNKVVHNLATEQQRLGFPVEVWGITPNPKEATTEREYKTRFFHSSFNKFKLNRELRDAIRGENSQSRFHFHGGFIPDFIPVSKELLAQKIPYSITPHGNYMKGAMQHNALIKKIYFQTFEQSLLRHAQFVHCIGKGEITDLHDLLAEAKVVLIPNGQRQEELTFKFSKLDKRDGLVFGFCGRITRHQKGLDLLLEGFRKYKTELHGPGELWLVGDGEYKAEIETYIRNHQLEAWIKLWGTRYGEEKLNIMANMNAFYHPSRNEGLPMAVLEAAGLGIPLVVSQFTNMTEYVNAYQAGISLKENTANDIAASMLQIYQAFQVSSLEQTGNSARTMAEKEFDWKIISQKLIDAHYQETISERI